MRLVRDAGTPQLCVDDPHSRCQYFTATEENYDVLEGKYGFDM